ncbi:MAG: YggS family pyridoxal phosphate-dependent enzyme [Muribaculaceae bacterium]|nr:YggS family pyridoxal phosphate-dependent enzyme [Muribaculaceae bacterium]
MGSVTDNLRRIKALIPDGVELVAVSKFHPAHRLQEAYDAGQRVFGESRANELTEKAAALPEDIRWHFIGHLQTNKVRQVVAAASVIESVDSERLLRAIDREATRIARRVKVLLQAHVAMEETKFGFLPDELLEFVTPELVDSLESVTIAGVMGMASNVDDRSRIEADFDQLKSLFDLLAGGVMAGNRDFKILSMGMSDDFELAIARGSTAVRIGTDIFGPREY